MQLLFPSHRVCIPIILLLCTTIFMLSPYPTFCQFLLQAKIDRQLDMSNNLTAVRQLIARFEEHQNQAIENYERRRIGRQLRLNSTVRLDQIRQQALKVGAVIYSVQPHDIYICICFYNVLICYA